VLFVVFVSAVTIFASAHTGGGFVSSTKFGRSVDIIPCTSTIAKLRHQLLAAIVSAISLFSYLFNISEFHAFLCFLAYIFYYVYQLLISF
jgi:hypothetical protein